MNGTPLAALLAHPHLRQVVDLAQVDTAVTEVRQVVVTTSTGEVPEADGALLVLLTPVARSDWRIDALLRRAGAAGAAVVVLQGVEPLAHGTRLLARRLRLPVLGAETPHDVATAARDLIMADVSNALGRAQTTVRRVTRAGPQVADVLQTLARALGRDVALVDAGGRPVQGDLTLEQHDVETVEAALREQHTALALPLPSGAVLVAAPIGVGSAIEGWVITSLARGLRADAAAVSLVLETAAPAVGQRLALRRITDERDARLRSSLLGELVHAEAEPTPDLRRRCLEVGWRLDGWHMGIQISPRAQVDTVGRRENLLRALREEGVDAAVVEKSDGWAAWTTFAQEPGTDGVQKAATAVRRAQRSLATTFECSVGIGRIHAGPQGVTRSLAEAADAATLAAERPSSGRFVHVDQLGLAQLLLAWTRTDTFLPAAQALLAPLTAQPGELLETLAAYLDAESSLVEAAAVLGVHRNTVSTRVSRIQQLLGVDLDDPETRLALHLACRTLQ